MSIRLICAIAKNNVIGNKNKLPWKISEDLKRFKELTSENIIVMGRKTYESIGRPLPKRENIVLSRNKNLEIQGVEVMNSIESVLDSYNFQGKDLYVIGGTFIYELFLEHCDYLHITNVERDYDGDAFFPEIDWAKWKLIEELNSYDDFEKTEFFFRDYKRI